MTTPKLSFVHVLLTTTLAVAAAAACGGAPPPQTTNPSGAGTGPTVPPSTGASIDGGVPGAVVGGPAGSAGGGGAGANQGPFSGPMKPFMASAMGADLQALGLDPKNLPALNKMEPDKLRKVMRTFTKALGARCTDCHNEGDFAAPTPMKKVAAGMWDHFVRDLQSADAASVLYCDSCHQGRMKMLDRHDKKALSKWMDDNFVAKTKRRDGKDHGCETCHGDPFEGNILGKWAGTGAR